MALQNVKTYSDLKIVKMFSFSPDCNKIQTKISAFPIWNSS